MSIERQSDTRRKLLPVVPGDSETVFPLCVARENQARRSVDIHFAADVVHEVFRHELLDNHVVFFGRDGYVGLPSEAIVQRYPPCRFPRVLDVQADEISAQVHLSSVGLCELARQTGHKVCEAETCSRAAECERPIFVSRTVIVVDGMLPGSAKSDLMRSSR